MPSFILGGESPSGVGFTGGAGVGLAGGIRWVWWQRLVALVEAASVVELIHSPL